MRVQTVRLKGDVIWRIVQPTRIDLRSTFDPRGFGDLDAELLDETLHDRSRFAPRDSHGLGARDAELLDDTLRDRFVR